MAAAEERTMEAETSSSEPAVAEDLPGGGSGAGEDRLVMYRTKLVQFLGRSTPIVLQNDNGPCPLLAICNVLLLRNVITLSPDVPEVSQEQLLALVADRLLESNSDVKSKDEGYVSNQQQNISDAIDLLPRLATGIDVNVHFRKINDFEFTRECAIFDLLDIGLYHGWIVDPEDTGTVHAIGSKSYNTLVGELVALQAHSSRSIPPEEDTVDFAAATAASLGIPSPCLSRGRSFDDHFPVPSEKAGRKGDLEEEEELMKVLSLSRSEFSTTPEHIEKSLSPGCSNTSSDIEESTLTEIPGNNSGTVVSEIVDSRRAVPSTALLSSPDTDSHVTSNTETTSVGAVLENNDNETLKNGSAGYLDGSISVHPVEISDYNALHSNIMTSQRSVPAAAVLDGSNIGHTNKSQVSLAEESSVETIVFDENISGGSFYPRNGTSSAFAEIHPSNKDIRYSGGRDSVDACQSGEPIYEGEECILDPVHLPYQNQEPVYEGEVLLVNQVDAAEAGTSPFLSDKESSGDKLGSVTISLEEGQLIYNFLESNASQLTIYGLFCLQEGLKERELCVFFRNNHFSTMFKFESELYLLATDQGYINQPDLVWEKLNEVNGDTVFMTGNFQVFRMDNQNDSWNRQNALTDTAQYLAELKKSSTEGSLSSDLQYAIQLQEQEFGQQPVCPEPQSSQHVPVARTGLVTGPQVPQRPPPVKQESKPKEKCVIM